MRPNSGNSRTGIAVASLGPHDRELSRRSVSILEGSRNIKPHLRASIPNMKVRESQKRTSWQLLNCLGGSREKRRRYCQTKRLCRLEINDQFKFGGLLHWKIGRFFASENTIDVTGGKSVQLNTIRPIRNQAARGDIEPLIIDGGQLVPRCERNDQFAM